MKIIKYLSFNPYSNGMKIEQKITRFLSDKVYVLILILME